MPARHADTAPTFDPQHPRQLRRYFDDLDLLFSIYKVSDDQEKLYYATTYVDFDTYELWTAIAQERPGCSYSDFVAAIFPLYPGADGQRTWSIADMENLVSKQSLVEICDVSDVGSLSLIPHHLCLPSPKRPYLHDGTESSISPRLPGIPSHRNPVASSDQVPRPLSR
jgi:hypothetical protein